MTKPLQSNKRLAALIIALFMGFGTAQAAYDFAAACATGQTLYYQITDFTNYYVSIVAPGNSSEWWPENTVKPANMIVIPQTVSYYGIDFTVTSIANNAFYTCDGLTILLQVPNTVTSIGNHAFYGCSSLRIANIPNTINSIGNYAFYGCNSLTSITIPNTINSIGNYAFYGCNSLTSITIPNTITSIGDHTFTGCSGLTSIEIPNSVTSIGEWAFSGCTGLTSIEIPNYVTSIGNYAFRYCRGLTSIEIPNFVTSIGNYAFYNCSGLTSVEIGNSVTSIGECAFEDCTGLTSVEIPNSVTSIGNYAFSGCTGLTSVEIPNSVTSIGRTAFGACRGLTSIEIPNSVTTIESYAFGGCTGLTSITVQAETPPSLGNNAFFYVDNSIPVYVPCGTNSAYRSAPGWKDFNNYIQFGCGIIFADANVKAICIANWDTNGDGRLNYEEAAAVTTLNPSGQSNQSVFRGNTAITSFDELQYFTGLSTIENEAFYGCSGLTSIEIPIFVTSIGNYAFGGCTGLTSIEIPDFVTSIGNYAFRDCTGLATMVVASGNTTYDSRDNCNAIIETATNTLVAGCKNTLIPNSVTSIGNDAFGGCTGLTSVEIPNSVTTIESYAFGGCTGLTSITVQAETPPSLGNNAFIYVNNSIPVYVPCGTNSAYRSAPGWKDFNNYIQFGCGIIFADENVKAICVANWDTNGDGKLDYEEAAAVTTLNPSGQSNQSVFRGNTAITSFDELQYFTGLSTIENSAFSGCSGLTSVEIGNSVTSIGNYAFSGCTGLTSVEIGNSVTSIGYAAFGGCTGLTSVEIPNSVTSIGEWAFRDCSGLTSIEIPNSVTSIGESAFYHCRGLTSVEIPNSVTSIGNNAFNGCRGLTSVEIPNSVTSIGNNAFNGCRGLTSVEIPNSVTSIGNNAFNGCTGLTSVTIGNSVTSIGSEAFSGCTGLATMVVASGNTTYDSRDNCNAIIKTATNTLVAGCKNTLIPNSVTSIGNYAFRGCKGLTSIEIPNSVTSIGNNAFNGCTGLTSVEIGNSVTSIGEWAFRDCSGLTSVEIGNSVTSIGNYAFSGCTGLTSVTIGNSITSIGNDAFSGCTGLATMVVASGNTTYDSRDNCNAIIKTATNTLVAGCKNTLIPNSVTSIGSGAFRNCTSLTSVEIPNSVTSIGHAAFSGCTGLTEITMLRTDVPSLSNLVFDNTNDCPIYVPYESLNNYKTASKWSNYASRIYPMAYTAVSGYSEGGGKWKFIASPLTEETEPTAVSNMTGTEYDLYRFNQSAKLEWENYKVHDFDLVNGQGYLYANTEDVNLVFKGTFNEGSSQTITLIYDEGKDFAGWNLVGNPFPVQAYANRSYYTMNAAGTVIEPTAASTSTAIPACTGVMVKAETTGQSVTFSKTASSAATNNGALQIAVAQANTRGAAVQDKAIVSFNAGDELGKFYFGESNAKLYIPQNGKELAIAYVCRDAARHVSTNEVPLNFKAEKNGEYTLSFDVANVIASEAKQSNLSEQFAYLHLIDNMNGADVDLLVSPEYTFNAKTSDYASRFRLVFSANESDGDNDGDNAFAFIDAGGNIVINGEGTLQVIDMMGRVVVCRDASNASAISTNGIPAGVYILRLINGNDVMTQKIVIE